METLEKNSIFEYMNFVDNFVKDNGVSIYEEDLLVDVVDYVKAGFKLMHGDVVLEVVKPFNAVKYVSCTNLAIAEEFNRIETRGTYFIYSARDLTIKEFGARMPLDYKNPKDIVSLLLHGKRVYTEDGGLLDFDLNTLAVRVVTDTPESKVTGYGRLEFGGETLPLLYVKRTTFLTPEEILKNRIKKILKREIDLTPEEIRLLTGYKIFYK